MNLTFTTKITVPKYFMTFLAKRGFVLRKPKGKFPYWELLKPTNSSADFERVVIEPGFKGYKIVHEYWGKPSSKKVYAYDTPSFSSFRQYVLLMSTTDIGSLSLQKAFYNFIGATSP